MADTVECDAMENDSRPCGVAQLLLSLARLLIYVVGVVAWSLVIYVAFWVAFNLLMLRDSPHTEPASRE
jgi:hypothetical protein